MSPLTRRTRRPPLALLAASLGAAVAAPASARAQPAPACAVADPCTAPRRAGEVSMVLLGDSGYGEGGASEWGGHAQAAVAKSIDALCPRPDLVFFLGDNIYWGGSPDLFGPRFDTMYRNLFDVDRRRVHAALGNHDVKGCQVAASRLTSSCTAVSSASRQEAPTAYPGSAATWQPLTSWLPSAACTRRRSTSKRLRYMVSKRGPNRSGLPPQ